MNLWVKRTGQLAMAVALFFLSCSDEVSFLGYPNPNSKFDIHYIEIPLESSVYLQDSIRTSNFSTELNRVLVGGYVDPLFGTIKTSGFAHLIPVSSIITANRASADIDSVALELRFDYYSYGASGNTKQTFTVHQLSEMLYTDSIGYYFSKKSIPYGDAIGSNSFFVDAAKFQTQFDKAVAEKDTAVIHISLDNAFGEQLLNLAKLTTGDSVYTKFAEFSKQVKGLAIVPGSANDKAVGFDINSTLDQGSLLSKVIVYYHADDEDSLKLNFAFGGVGYTRIETDRAATPDLSAFPAPPNNFYSEITPATFRYSQSGTGVITKVDFGKFFEFADQVPRMIINSCELSITGLENFDQFAPMNAFTMQVLKDDNRVRRTKYDINYTISTTGDTLGASAVVRPSDAAILDSYKRLINDVNGVFTPISDTGEPATLQRDGGSFGSHITLLAQQLYQQPATQRFRYYGLAPSSPPSGKTLNRVVFNKDNLKLKVYYTIPTVVQE